MSANGISTLVTKQAKQEAKLVIAEAKRQGYTVDINGNIGNVANTSQPYYRTLNSANIQLLPTRYVGNLIVDNITDGNVLVNGRPWY